MRAKQFLCFTTESRAKVWYQLDAFKPPSGLSCCPFKRCGSVVDSLFIVALIVCGSSLFGPCFVMQYLVSLLVLQLGQIKKYVWFRLHLEKKIG